MLQFRLTVTTVLLSLTLLSCGGGDPNSNDEYDIEMTSSGLGVGSYQITGTVDLFIPGQAGSSVDLRVDLAGVGYQVESQVLRVARTKVRYRVTGLPSGTYTVRVRVDMNANSTLGESGDLEGWYDGSSLIPILDPFLATTETIANSDLIMNFGIGPRP